jgi:hypothetical protein
MQAAVIAVITVMRAVAAEERCKAAEAAAAEALASVDRAGEAAARHTNHQQGVLIATLQRGVAACGCRAPGRCMCARQPGGRSQWLMMRAIVYNAANHSDD